MLRRRASGAGFLSGVGVVLVTSSSVSLHLEESLLDAGASVLFHLSESGIIVA